MSRIPPVRLARATLLLGLAVLTAKLLATGQIRYYMSPSFDGVTALTGVVLAAMGARELWRAFHAGCDPALEFAKLDAALTLGLVAVPLVLGLTLSPRSLGFASLGGTSVTALVLAFDAEVSTTVSRPPARRAIADVGDLLSYVRQFGQSGVGQQVRVRGLVAHGDDLPANQFVLLRYMIVHCVADAQPLGFLVDVPGDSNFTSDGWVEVDGKLASAARGSDRLVEIQAEHIMPSEEPADPYVSAY
jgi:uncharacterized repeat protein (TIGR03943 family)